MNDTKDLGRYQSKIESPTPAGIVSVYDKEGNNVSGFKVPEGFRLDLYVADNDALYKNTQRMTVRLKDNKLVVEVLDEGMEAATIYMLTYDMKTVH